MTSNITIHKLIDHSIVREPHVKWDNDVKLINIPSSMLGKISDAFLNREFCVIESNATPIYTNIAPLLHQTTDNDGNTKIIELRETRKTIPFVWYGCRFEMKTVNTTMLSLTNTGVYRVMDVEVSNGWANPATLQSIELKEWCYVEDDYGC